MRIRMLLTMSAVAAIAMIAPNGHAAANVCGGTAPRVSECSVEGFVITADNPNMQVSTTLFVGVVSAKMTGPNGWSKVSCFNTVDPMYEGGISTKCYQDKLGVIMKGDTVNIVANATGKPGAVPAVGNWSVQYAAS